MKNQKEIKAGDVLFLQSQKPTKGNFPISRTDDGKICLFKPLSDQKFFAKYGSVWMCSVIEVREKSLIVQPIEQCVTAEENEINLSRKVKEVFGKDKQKKAKPAKKSYQFKSSHEFNR